MNTPTLGPLQLKPINIQMLSSKDNKMQHNTTQPEYHVAITSAILNQVSLAWEITANLFGLDTHHRTAAGIEILAIASVLVGYLVVIKATAAPLCSAVQWSATATLWLTFGQADAVDAHRGVWLCARWMGAWVYFVFRYLHVSCAICSYTSSCFKYLQLIIFS